jgi:hypothetical protein
VFRRRQQERVEAAASLSLNFVSKASATMVTVVA